MEVYLIHIAHMWEACDSVKHIYKMVYISLLNKILQQKSTSHNPISFFSLEIPQGNPPEFSAKLRDQSIPEGGRLQLDCKVKGEPTPDVHWFKDGICIDKHHDYHITRHRDGTCRLELAEVMPEDAGTFMCKAENDCGVAEAKGRLRVTGENNFCYLQSIVTLLISYQWILFHWRTTFKIKLSDLKFCLQISMNVMIMMCP